MQFHMPVKLFFGAGEIGSLARIVNEQFGATAPVLITDKGVADSGLLDRITDQIPGIRIYDRIEPNPKSDTVNKIAEELREQQADLVIGFGGGSPLDAGKALALLGTNPGNIEAYEGRAKYQHPPLPFLAIPTTCGTGSEVTWVSVITDVNRKFKMSIKGPQMYPAVSIVDPDLIKTLPPHIIASTGLDALTHAVEAYLSKPATLITDIHAVKAVKLILGAVEKAYQDVKNNHAAREDLMFGSTVAGFAFGNSDVTAVHCISESVGALFDIPHGVANSIFLPHVLEYNLDYCTSKMAELARKAGINDSDDRSAATAFIRQIADLSVRLDIPLFRDLCIGPDHFEKIALMSVENNSNPSNPRPLMKDDYLNILENAYR
jgi:alcohol dehydrogenase